MISKFIDDFGRREGLTFHNLEAMLRHAGYIK